MCKISFNNILILSSTVLLMLGCAHNKPDESRYSGFLQDYTQLEASRDDTGKPMLRYVSPQLTSGQYKNLILDPVQFFPEPQPTEQVSGDTLAEIKDYINMALRRELGESIQFTNQPGPDTIRMRVALTGVGAKAESLKPHQYIPVALVLTGARAAAGGHPEQSEIYLEAEITDSVKGDRLAIVVRSGKGERVKKIRSESDNVTLDSVKSLIDNWASAYAQCLLRSI
jgi:hypothetical protein